MGRRKVKVAYIEKEAARRTTFRKRRRGLLKKAEELATLCDVRTCAVVYGEGEARPEVWPSEDEARAMLQRFKDMPPSDQSKKMLNQEGLMQQCITKQKQKLRRILLNNQELQMTILMLEAMAGRSPHDLSVDDAATFSRFLEAKAKALHDRICAMKEHTTGATTATSCGPAKDELPAAQKITESVPMGHNAPVVGEVPAWQRNGIDIPMPNEHNTQMFLGSGSSSGGGGGLDEMNMNSTWMPFYYNPWPQWMPFYYNPWPQRPPCEDIN